jgi:hypothetical protein
VVEAGPSDLEIVPTLYVEPELPVDVLEPGDPVELWRAPQGGHVVRFGVRVKGLESSFIEERVRVRVPDTGLIIAEETRTAAMEVVPEDPTLKQNDRRSVSQVVHVALCPDYDARDIVNMEHLVQIEVTELYADFSRGSAEVRVVPKCLQTDPAELAECQCECTANYVLGKCRPDAGSPHADGGDGG